jgi:hypothetical protein
MKQMPSTLYLFLKQEWITVGVYCVATLLFFMIVFAGGINSTAADRSGHQSITLLLMSMLSVFVGLYLGSGFLRLKQSPLWKILPSYKHTLVASLVAAAMLYAIVQSIAMFYADWSWPIALLAPPAITLLTAQAVIGSNLIMKVILPISPFVLFQLNYFYIDQNIILAFLLVVAIAAIYLNYINDKVESELTLGLMSSNIDQQLKSVSIQKINNIIGDFFIKLGVKNNFSNLSVALMRPKNRFGISSIFGSLIALFFFHSMEDGKIELEGLAAFMFTTILLGVFIELKMLAKQCKPFAHLYSGEDFWILKKKILSTLQRYILFQATIYIVGLSTLSFWLTHFIEPMTLIRYTLSVSLVGMIFLPAFLCLNWFTVNFKLISVVLLYVASAIVACGWFYDSTISTNLYLQIGLSLSGLILIGFLARLWWKTQPIELFFRTHG